ncbi:MAG TPA: hypothetical protein VFZ47_03370 [Chitinophagaceae bacterium]
MTAELKKYLVEQCRAWMSITEIASLRRIELTEHGVELAKKSALSEFKMEKIYQFGNEKVNELVKLGKEKMEMAIAERLLKDHGDELINNCPKCGRLARTPYAKQCRHCKHDWH